VSQHYDPEFEKNIVRTGMSKFKVIEWNINQRVNSAKRDMPDWIADVIHEEQADIIALTEVYKVNNWNDIKKKLFDIKVKASENKYMVFETDNYPLGQNDICVAVNTEKFSVVKAELYPSNPDKNIPDNLAVEIKSKKSGKVLVIACMRIHSLDLVSDDIKIKELKFILDQYSKADNVIICGDFNNYRRGVNNRLWCLKELEKSCNKNGFRVITPKGSSIYEDEGNNVDYEFPEDHFLLKCKNKDIVLSKGSEKYNRDFVDKNRAVYRFGKDFQKNLGKDANGNYMYEHINPPFPDHAILEGEFEI